jgi:hypothetical protein
MNGTIARQLRRHSVALVSLALAAASLLYSAWRAEQSEFNENIRDAAFQVLLHIGELQMVVFHNHYDHDAERGNPRTGWAYVLTIHDLAQLQPPPLPERAIDLKAIWSTNWEGLGNDDASVERINGAIDATRAAAVEVLRGLR